MIAYIELVRDTGAVAGIRPDEIAAYTENKTKTKDGKEVDCLTILLRNNLAWHFPGLTRDELHKRIRSVTGIQVNALASDAVA